MAYNDQLTMDQDWGNVDGIGTPATGFAVQNFIKSTFKEINEAMLKKIGYLHGLDDSSNNKGIIIGFADQDSYTEWVSKYPSAESQLANGLNDDLVISYAEMPKAQRTEPSYVATIGNTTKNSNGTIVDTIVSTDNTIKLSFKFISTMYDINGEQSDSGESGTLQLSTRKDYTGTWKEIPVGDIEKYIPEYNQIQSGVETEIDVTNLLSEGYQELRIQIVGNEHGKKTPYLIFKLTKTVLSATLKTKWSQAQKNKMVLDFVVTGLAVDKYLHINFYGAGGTAERHEERHVGVISTNEQHTYEFTDLTDSKYKVLNHGVHEIEYWVTVGNNSDDPLQISTEKKYAQIMMDTDDNNKDSYIVINNLKTNLTNWTQETLFDYAIFTDMQVYPLTLSLRTGDGVEYFTIHNNVAPGKEESFMLNIEIDDDQSILLPQLYFNNVETGEELRKPIQFYISNSGNYAPVAGADFIFNPKIKSNTDGAVEKVINSVDNEEVSYVDSKGQIIKSQWSGFNFNNADGWIQDNDNNKCLRVLAGQTLSIPYFPYGGTTKNSCTIEMTIATRNITDDTKKLLSIGSYNVNEETGVTELNGFELRPLSAVFLMNENVDSQAVRDARDIMFAEDEKTHIVINIYKNLYSAGDDFPLQYIKHLPSDRTINTKVLKDINMVRIFVNGRINREFLFNDDICYLDEDSLLRSIQIGDVNAGADLDVYGIRIYKKPLSVANIQKNYIASLPTITEKDIELKNNDILDEGTGTYITYDKVKDKYNTLLWKYNDSNPYTRPNGKEFGDEKKGNEIGCDLVIRLGNRDENGDWTIDNHLSGTINNLSTEGQGTSAMTYWKWNQRWKFNDDSIFTTLDGEELEGCYRLNDDDPLIKRLDGKINWASPMQSHKIGSTALYNDLWRAIVGGNKLTELNSEAAFENVDLENTGSKAITAAEAFEAACDFTGLSNGYESCRVTVHQEPFMLFWQPKEDAEPIFYGLYTWGASKGDKPTFGYNKKFNKNFIMIEGTDNGRPLVMHRVPWDDVHVTQGFEEDDGDFVVDGGNKYNTQEQWEVSMGDDSLGSVGENWDNNPCLAKFKEMCNFIYLLNPHIHPFNGKYSDMIEAFTADQKQFNTDDFYWINSDEGDGEHKQYNLYRYNTNNIDGESSWVHAGLYESGKYQPINLLDQTGLTVLDLTGSIDDKNNKFISKRAELFKNGIGNYIHTQDLFFTMQFLKLIAGSDNWGKNTYIYNTGIVDKDGNLDKFRFFQDDLDTIFEIDNSGLKTKPYYVEEHDVKPDGMHYWNSQNNALYRLTELAFEDELRRMMYNILSNMTNIGGSIEGCFEKYYQDKAQDYFPMTAYNEAAKLLYEDNQARDIDPTGTPLSQSLGDQAQAERQWQKMRAAYLSSYACYGDFGARASEASQGALIFRSATGSYNFNMVPHIWMYPSMASGSTEIMYGDGRWPKRVQAKEPINIKIDSVDGDTQVVLRGVNYMDNIGNFAQHEVHSNHDINLFGKRLTEFTVVGTSKNPILFAPRALGISEGMGCLERFEIRGTTNKDVLSTELNLSSLWKLKYVDVSATKLQKVDFPVNSSINTIKLPKTIKNLRLDNQTKLVDFDLPGTNVLTDLYINNTNIDTLSLFRRCKESNKLTNLYINNIDWEITLDEINYILGIKNCILEGVIKTTDTIDFDMKMKLISKFGNIDDPENALHIKYTKNYLSSEEYVEIIGRESIYRNGNYSFTLDYPSDIPGVSANDVINIEWGVSDTRFGIINQTSGVYSFIDDDSITDKDERVIEVYCNIIRLNASNEYITIEKSKKIYLYQLVGNIGDYLYTDGTYGSAANHINDKTVVGICIWADDNEDPTKQVRIACGVETLGDDVNGQPIAVAYGLNDIYKTFNPAVEGLTRYALSGTASNPYNWPYDNQEMYITEESARKAVVGANDGTITGQAINDKDGKINTEYIISYRDRILTADKAAKPISYKDLNEKLINLSGQDNRGMRARYYPAASYCNLYEPGVIYDATGGQRGIQLKPDEVLADNLKRGNWYLPSYYDLVNLWYCVLFRKNIKTGGSNDPDTSFDSFNLISNIDYVVNNNDSYLRASTQYNSSGLVAMGIRFTINKLGGSQYQDFSPIIWDSSSNSNSLMDRDINTYVIPVVKF